MDISYYITYDLPVTYRGLELVPLTMRDYMLFNAFSQCLTLDKNSIPDIKIISMTELEYIYYASKEDIENKPYIIWFDRLLSLCSKNDKSFENPRESISRYKVDKNGKPYFLVLNEKYTDKDFKEIKSIICQQNMVDVPDENISKEVRDSLEEARKYKQKLTGGHSASLEDYMVALSIATGWTIEYIYGMTIRKFSKSIQRIDNLIHYKIFLTSSMSGMVEFKDKSFIKHWLINLDDDDKYGDVSIDLEKMQSKVSLESAK